jgi:signal transduction histidine kinase
MMFNTLYSKLSAVLFGLVLIIGFLFFQLVSYSTEMYQHEATQKLNATLADHIADDVVLLNDGEVNHDALKKLFHMSMVINPNIEIYLLDASGKILDYVAPERKIKRTQVDLGPVSKFMKPGTRYPLMGDDPRNPVAKKIFSVAPIINRDVIDGYVYVILGGEKYDSVAEMLQSSYIARFTAWGLAASLLVALVAGLIIFFLLTRRLFILSNVMSCYAIDDKNCDSVSHRYVENNSAGDEIDRLGKSFNTMADCIDRQVQEVKRTDAQRRELIANVSHDLRTPLATLHGYLETLMLKYEDFSDEERKKYIAIAASHSDRLGELVTELFELSRLDSCETLLNVEPFSLGELIQDVVQKFELSASQKNIRLITQFGEDIPFAYGDIGLIQRVLENLIENALRHTPEGGNIGISLSADTGKIHVKVADNGIGIPENELPKIFDRSYRLQKYRESSGEHNAGLGLAIAKRIIALHGSDITAESRLNHGTTFSFNIDATNY